MKANSTHVPPIHVESSFDTSEFETAAVPENQPKSILRKSVDFVEKLSPLPEGSLSLF